MWEVVHFFAGYGSTTVTSPDSDGESTHNSPSVDPPFTFNILLSHSDCYSFRAPFGLDYMWI